MTATGHNERKAAILANLARKGETRHEVKHVIPPEVAQAIDIMRQEIAQLKAAANDHELRIVELHRLLSTHTHETIRAVA